MQGALTLLADAKINLGLDVLGRRPDGYHELRMIMQTVTLSDVIALKVIPENEVRLTASRRVTERPEQDLTYRAASLMRERFGIRDGVEISVSKRIPAAAGLAGGSADAAAVLRGMDMLFGLGCGKEALAELGLSLGADVPFCVYGGTKLAEGVGERLTSLPPLPRCAFVIVKPPVDVPTKHVFSELHVDSLPAGAHPDMDAALSAVRAGDVRRLAGTIGNILETVTEREFPEIGDLKRAMLEQGAYGSLMSGSGSSVFGIFPGREEAERCASYLRERSCGEVFVAEPSAEGGRILEGS